MEHDPKAIHRSLVTRGRREIEVLRRELMELNDEFIKAGHGGGGSRFEVVRREVLRKAYHSLCDEVAIQLAEILGSFAPTQAHVLDAALSEIESMVLETYGSRAKWGNPTNYVAVLQEDLASIRSDVVNDIILGIAGGKNVKKHFVHVNVDNRNATAPQTAVGSNINQTIGNVAINLDPADVLRLAAQLREQLAGTNMLPEQADEVEDALISVEREAQEPQPNVGRIRRSLGVVRSIAESVGAKLAVEAIVKALG